MMPTRTFFGTVAFLLFIAWTGAAVATALWTLSDTDWRADIKAVADAIREIHPRPFRTTREADFNSSYQQLLEDVPKLSDKEIIVRLAALVALVDDGHTRLEEYELRVTVTVRDRADDRLAVRANARVNDRLIDEPGTYQDFFTVLDKAIFLTRHSVD